jgi:hypothetical protein
VSWGTKSLATNQTLPRWATRCPTPNEDAKRCVHVLAQQKGVAQWDRVYMLLVWAVAQLGS